MFSNEFNALKDQLDLSELGITQDDLKVPEIPVSQEGAVSNPVQEPVINSLQDSLVNNIMGKPPEKPSFATGQKPTSPVQPPIIPSATTEKFTKEEKESVICSFVAQEKFIKKYKLNKIFTIVLKTINDDEQHILNETLQKIDLKGEKRKHSYFYGGGTGEEFETNYHVDAFRERRLTILSYHLDSISDKKLPSGEEGRQKSLEALAKLPTNLINAIYSKCMVPFLELVEEACKDIEVF